MIYRHPWNNPNVFLEALDVSMQKLNRHGDKTLIFSDIILFIYSLTRAQECGPYLNNTKKRKEKK